MTDPIDRSIPPVMMTKATPILMTPNMPVQRVMLEMLPLLTNPSLSTAVDTQMKINSPRMPRILFMFH